ncbi:MAG: hypothetical protein IT424_10745 [Pirellulales bacterium]|nr:hypothetical protein [Pirellulales bacterium]
MSAKSLLTKLAAHGIDLHLAEGVLRFRAPKGVLTADLKDQIVERRADIISQLRPPTEQGAKSLSAACLCGMELWVDEPPQDARIRTHCGNCGKFIGYRPENLTNDGNKSLEPGHHA